MCDEGDVLERKKRQKKLKKEKKKTLNESLKIVLWIKDHLKEWRICKIINRKLIVIDGRNGQIGTMM